MTNWITEKCVQAGCRTSQMITKLELPLTHLTHYASHGEQFLQYIVTGDETFVNHMMLKTSIASVMCKQPSSYPTEKEFKEMPYVTKSEQLSFISIKCASCGFTCNDTVTAELSCGTTAGHLL